MPNRQYSRSRACFSNVFQLYSCKDKILIFRNIIYMPQTLTLKEFFQTSGPILDVRSPSEFYQGHIPTSHSFSLFSDEERARIGTVYKKQSRIEAVKLGLWLI